MAKFLIERGRGVHFFGGVAVHKPFSIHTDTPLPGGGVRQPPIGGFGGFGGFVLAGREKLSLRFTRNDSL
jgi:hypothetical protein